MNKKDIGIYVHIPFCLSKCSYCDFPSFSDKDGYYEKYVDSLISEINSYYNNDFIIQTIFIGGGTPTVLPPILLEKILSAIYKYNIYKNCEITIEANPETLTLDYLRQLKNFGVNRISIGLQSTSNKILKSIGRIHSFEKFYEEYNNCIKVGLTNVNIDLMFSLPGQTIKNYKNSLEIVTSLNPTHISSYSLILEENTPLFKDYKDNKINLPTEDLDRQLYQITNETLLKSGYNRYEISNYCKPTYECRHNLSYWKQVPYIGFGLGAHSYYKGCRFNNTYDFYKYITSHDIVENKLVISKKACMEEFMFLGLRIINGILISDFNKKFNISLDEVFGPEIDKLIDLNLLVKADNVLRLTTKGIDLSNYVFSKFIL